jgi:PadR family transcriptional regulator PadR
MSYNIREITYGALMKLLSRSEEIILLAVWRLEGNAFGISIRDQVSEATGYRWTLGAIYVPLDKLTRKGYVAKSYSRPMPRRGGRSKVLYRLTPEGREALRTVREIQTSLWKGIPGHAFEEET